jgi:hypothetical protein
MMHDRVAFDRAASARTVDQDGHLHVASSVISAAAVNPYNGSEIPDNEALGLDPNKVYQLFRDPAELEKATATFANKPLMIVHKAQLADTHDRDVVVGSISNPVWDAPYLKAELVVWDAAAIKAIESGEQKELSCGYRYTADMTPGTYEGKAYQGVMRGISGNHVALVSEGRVNGAVVGDSALREEGKIEMSKIVLTRKGAAAFGALSAYMKPKMATDQKIDLAPLFAGISAKNFKDKKAGIVTSLKKSAEGKLAKDANIDDVTELLDALEDVLPIEVADPGTAATVSASTDPDDDKAKDSDDTALRAFLKEKGMSDEDIEKACAMLGAPAAATDGENPFAKKDDDDKAKTAKDAEKKDEKDMVTKPAMDAAIAAATKAAIKTAQDAMIKMHQEIREAEKAVRPYVGELAIAHDSAEAVYRTALKALKVNVAEDVHPSALAAILSLVPVPGAQVPRTPVVAADAAAATGFNTRYPQAARIRSL